MVEKAKGLLSEQYVRRGQCTLLAIANCATGHIGVGYGLSRVVPATGVYKL